MISYDYYRVFYYAGKYRNFTRAADVLCTSQSNVSHCIQTLEHQLGCRLFIRKSRGIELTAEGETLYEHIARGCEQFMLGESAIHSGVGLDSGTIYLGATETALHYFLFNALDLFHARYPNVRFRVANFNTYEALGALQNGRIDLAVVTGPAPAKPPIVQKTLLQIHDVLFGLAAVPRTRAKRIRSEKLIRLPLHLPFLGNSDAAPSERFFLADRRNAGTRVRNDNGGSRAADDLP